VALDVAWPGESGAPAPHERSSYTPAMWHGWLVVLGVVSCAFGLVRPAKACGGGVVTTTELDTSVGATQRVVMGVHDGVTDIVVQIGVPETTADYGALLPEPYEPTLDPNPVSASELDALDEQTAPQVFETDAGDDGGIGCPCVMGSMEGDAKGTPRDVDVSQPTDIGPVTAVVITATDGAALRAWLGDNGFKIPAKHDALIDEYSGPARYFIALKRNQAAATGGPTSIGVHFTLPVAHAELPLRFARLGAASKVTFTVFIAAPETLVPAPPFETTTLAGLDGLTLRLFGYAAAVEAVSARNGGHGFVLEGSYRLSELDARLGALGRLLGGGDPTISRLTTITTKSSLDTDAHFTEAFTDDVPRERFLSNKLDVSKASAVMLVLALLARRPRRRTAKA
jgi:hypothetical protein